MTSLTKQLQSAEAGSRGLDLFRPIFDLIYDFRGGGVISKSEAQDMTRQILALLQAQGAQE
jgi:hypothetical protein